MVMLPQVDGPVVVEIDLTPREDVELIGSLTFVPLGVCSENGRPSISSEWLTREVFSDENGLEPIEVVHTGRLMTLDFTLSKIDTDAALLPGLVDRATPGAAAEGDAGAIGGLFITHTAAAVPAYAAGATFALRFSSRFSGRSAITFDQCLFQGEGIREFNMGNDGTLWAFSIRVIRFQTTAVPLTGDLFYTRGTV